MSDCELAAPVDYIGMFRERYRRARARVWVKPVVEGSDEPLVVQGAPALPSPLDVAQSQWEAKIAEAHCILDAAMEAMPRDDTITVVKIQRACADHYGIPSYEMVSSTRTKGVVKARQVAMWMARILTRRSYPDIGSRFGNRDHTTVLHGVNKIARMLLKGDDELRQDIDAIKKVLGVCR